MSGAIVRPGAELERPRCLYQQLARA